METNNLKEKNFRIYQCAPRKTEIGHSPERCEEYEVSEISGDFRNRRKCSESESNESQTKVKEQINNLLAFENRKIQNI